MPTGRAVIARCAGSSSAGLSCAAASTSKMGRFETEWLANDENLAVLTFLSGQWIDCVQ